MRWLLIAALLSLPFAGACAGGAEKTDGDAETVTEEAAMKYECKDCKTKSAEAAKCDCGSEMTLIE